MKAANREESLKPNESDIVVFDIQNPKIQGSSSLAKESRVFPYYAGYASSFASHMLSKMSLAPGSVVVDPWNGSGTTTLAAAAIGVRGIGFDLNPVMILAAKAALLRVDNCIDVKALGEDLLRKSNLFTGVMSDDPLNTWIVPSATRVIRAIEDSINKLLVSDAEYTNLVNTSIIDAVRPIAAFFYICLFRSVRKLLMDFVPSNPTWVKRPSSLRNRKRPSRKVIERGFIDEVKHLSLCLPSAGFAESDLTKIEIRLGDAKSIYLESNSVDVILTSPPYCTRIDYAVATSIELAVLRCSKEQFDSIRRSLMGNSTVEKIVLKVNHMWGETCVKFLEDLYNHTSQASKTYYYKTHLQYFASLKISIAEAARVLKRDGRCIFVVQDSNYKEIRNDIAQITIDMAASAGLILLQRKDFLKNNSMSVINSRAKKYLSKRQTTEAVLVFALQ